MPIENLYDCTLSGLIQIDQISKPKDKNYTAIDAQFPLDMSKDHIIYPVGTAFKITQLQPPFVADFIAGFVPLPEPKLTYYTLKKFMDPEQVPNGWIPPSPTITGIVKAENTDDPTAIRGTLQAYDRGAGKMRSAPVILTRDPDGKNKGSTVPTKGATIYFSGKISFQQETSRMFVISLDHYTWVSQAELTPAIPPPPASPTDPSTSKKRPRLGTKQTTAQHSAEAGPSGTSSH
ncbi:hypothetical protein OC842_001279 [Tilletia horrida]|uniref:Uncharacterized protein n=1 Tax=Tilletia horrida TaxID=155126 RepID=A0AAN6GFZ3_9BASI|nr:hypothetical protein OC842_001279 [Tilletia horrida]